MSLAAYALFAAIAEQKSLTKAAEILNITPSAASHSISSLEHIWGFPLFVRDRNGAKLTRNGELLLPRIRAILNENERLQEEVDQVNDLERGTICLGVFNSVCSNWLPGILHTFQPQHPHIVVNIYQDGYSSIETMLLDGLLDLGFVSLPTTEKFSVITLLHDRFLCITPPGCIPENQTYITVDDLRRQPLIFSQRGFDRVTKEFLRANNLELSPNYHVTLESSVISFVENGFGCSILPELTLRGCPGKYNAYPLAENIYRTLALATLRGQAPSPACRTMIQTIRDYVGGVTEKN
jgi:DNA-binding transcriptional LysR family regulator